MHATIISLIQGPVALALFAESYVQLFLMSSWHCLRDILHSFCSSPLGKGICIFLAPSIQCTLHSFDFTFTTFHRTLCGTCFGWTLSRRKLLVMVLFTEPYSIKLSSSWQYWSLSHIRALFVVGDCPSNEPLRALFFAYFVYFDGRCLFADHYCQYLPAASVAAFGSSYGSSYGHCQKNSHSPVVLLLTLLSTRIHVLLWIRLLWTLPATRIQFSYGFSYGLCHRQELHSPMNSPMNSPMSSPMVSPMVTALGNRQEKKQCKPICIKVS